MLPSPTFIFPIKLGISQVPCLLLPSCGSQDNLRPGTWHKEVATPSPRYLSIFCLAALLRGSRTYQPAHEQHELEAPQSLFISYIFTFSESVVVQYGRHRPRHIGGGVFFRLSRLPSLRLRTRQSFDADARCQLSPTLVLVEDKRSGTIQPRGSHPHSHRTHPHLLTSPSTSRFARPRALVCRPRSVGCTVLGSTVPMEDTDAYGQTPGHTSAEPISYIYPIGELVLIFFSEPSRLLSPNHSAHVR